MARRGKKRPASRRLYGAARRHPWRAAAVVVLLGTVLWLAWLDWLITDRFEGKRWDLPARVYARPLELYEGKELEPALLEQELLRSGYRRVSGRPDRAGTYTRQAADFRLVTREFRFWDELQPALALHVSFGAHAIRRIDGPDGELPVVRLDPLLVGSLFPKNGEDRLVVTPGEVPPLLRDALKVVEDRRFEQHFGIDLYAIGRALVANLKAGAVRQGGSTLTQQLVKNYFLDNRRTLWRKLQEAAMSVILELHYDKDEILNAYVNEIYMGQDGARAIHGFGLASQFYFSRPLDELDLSRIALLVALVRGPVYYDPLRHPERAVARRNLVLALMEEAGVIGARESAQAKNSETGIWDRRNAGASYYPAYLALVREQLAAGYRDDDLTRTGLRIFTALDPLVQASAERRVAEGLAALDGGRPPDRKLAGAAVVTSTESGDVLAIVGDRRAGYEGFNRALHARRPVGSLIKPVVYLAALESGRYTLASRIEDAAITVPLPNGKTWEPHNFDNEVEGEVTLLRALAESLNLATVRLGMDVGVDAVARLLPALGFEGPFDAYPSLLLGAVAMTPVEVAGIYGTLANGGFRTPLRAVRSVVDPGGAPLQRYPLQVAQVADTASIYELNQGLEQVLRRGTGRSAVLPDGLAVAGKTGTSDEFRDSWFAGYSGDRVAVVWVGYDDYAPTRLTGASGALGIWSAIMRDVAHVPFVPAAPVSLESRWVDYYSGAETGRNCDDAVALALPEHTRLPRTGSCGIGLKRLGKRTLEWLNDVIH